jgi:hypothetical protein
MEKILNITPSQFSWSVSIFFFGMYSSSWWMPRIDANNHALGYILFEVPSNLMLKKATPARWIARIMVSWGILSASLAAIHSFTDLMILRFLLGVAEAG